MIFKNFDELKKNNFPVVIIGSGPAGISTAIKLEEKKIRCLIIEAGEEEYSDSSQMNYSSKIIGDQITDLQFSRLRQFGGTSGQWGGWSKPMDSYNLNEWPVTYEELDKYTNQTCQILGIKNDFNKSKINDYFNQIQFQYSQVRFKEKYQEHIEKSKYINLILSTQVTKFLGNAKFVESIECNSRGTKLTIPAKYFVLATGGVENSRILLWTKENNPSLLNKNLPIGKYWMTHPWFIGGYGVLVKSELQKKLKGSFIDYEGPLHIASSKNLKLKENILSGAIYMSANEDGKFYKEIIKDLLCIAPEFGKKVARKAFGKDLKCGNIFMHLEESPNEMNKITLDPTIKDKNNVPISNLHYRESQNTIFSAKKILEEFANTCRNLSIGRVALKNQISELKNYDSLGVYHHMGGTRLGNDKGKSVVDKNLKIHDSPNLFVAGSSVFPTSGYTNPTFTIIQLSLRLGDHIFKVLS